VLVAVAKAIDGIRCDGLSGISSRATVAQTKKNDWIRVSFHRRIHPVKSILGTYSRNSGDDSYI